MTQTRVVTAVVLLVVFGSALFLAPPGVFALLLVLLAGISSWEWARLAGVRSERLQQAYGIALGLLVLLVLSNDSGEPLARFITLASLLFWFGALAVLVLSPVRQARPAGDVLLLSLGVLLIGSTAFAIQYLRSLAPSASVGLLLHGFLIVWFMDIGAYFVGRRFGRRKLSPSISPGKSWEGVYGGIAVTLLLVLGSLLVGDWPDGSARAVLIGSVLAAGASVVGDLYESRLKRSAGFKDSSNLLPGHGGVLDRIDGVLAAIPVFAFAWAWL